MKKSNSDISKLTPLQILERSYNKYIEYETAFNKDPFDESKVKEELLKVIESGVDFDSSEFEDAVIDLMVEKPTRRSDVNNAAMRFFMYTEFFLMTQEEGVPEKILKDYESLPIKDAIKPSYSIENGKFIRNENIPINVNKEKLRELYRALQEESK